MNVIWCKTVSELEDFISFVVVYGPDRFPAFRKMDMDTAFREITLGLKACSKEIGSELKSEKLAMICSDAKNYYASGDDLSGAHKLQEIMELLNS